MALVPVPQAGRLLRWNSTATALENATISDLLDEIAGAVAPDPAVRRYWLATPGAAIVAGGISLALTPGAPTVVAVAPVSRAFTLTGISVPLTPTAPGVQVQAAGNFATTLTGIALPLTVTAPAVAKSSAATLTGISLALTPGNPGVSTAANVSVSAQTLDLSMTPNAPTAATAAGGGVSVSDNFNRANGGLGSNWTTLTGTSAPSINANIVVGSSPPAAARWSADTFAANQYAQVQRVNISTAFCGGPAVRLSAAAQTGYFVDFLESDDGEGGVYEYIFLQKVVGGTVTQIGTDVDIGSDTWARIEVSGTTITVKSSANGTTWTTRITQTDSSIASGSAGLYIRNSAITLDNWSGGDL